MTDLGQSVVPAKLTPRVWAAFKIVNALDVASHYVSALVPLYVRSVHWSEDMALKVQG